VIGESVKGRVSSLVNALEELTRLPREELIERGIEHTPREILSQPRLWIENFNLLKRRVDEIRLFVESRIFLKRLPRVILTGAGSSAFVGLSAENLLRYRWRIDVDTRATTDLVTSWNTILLKHADNTMISFARSGNSPESMGAIMMAEKFCGEMNHIIITCNKDGRLAKFGMGNEDALLILLTPETNDKGLSMTSSFTTMLMAAQFLAHIDDPERYEPIVKDLAEATKEIFNKHSEAIREIAKKPFDRAVFLGTGTLHGCAVESALKLQELSNGRVICMPDTFMGVRHGPEVAIDDETLVVYFVSSDPFVRRYELDLMESVWAKGLGMIRVAVCDRADGEIERYTNYTIEFDEGGKYEIPDLYRPVMDVTVGQMLGLFKSLALNLKPDNPSESGVITRVVKGVRIYDPDEFKRSGRFKVIVSRD